ncbi:uncharacterized protein PV09_00448 [Verruconis gallopava]|uniref:tRNA (adenine(58)-N(1))-methyltransferase non-catalytic subunit TRM6 n=1 Tax=Verruconis gallopava TaxID=253628 RepID=A0A0D1Y3S8_9PEZI|nr:uncharacterized protein PV09_00448 [Verruconis gallopava]KIW09576.1 hypothetical protein PV09_00448 [Verruconis gallopava]
MQSYVLPNTNVVLRLQNGQYKVAPVTADTTISIPKYGSFSANLLIGRPYYVTYELVEKQDEGDSKKKITLLRAVPAAELHAETLSNDTFTPAESRDEKATGSLANESFDLVTDEGEVLIRNNRLTIDDPSRQALSHEEIEALKKASAGSGKEIIAKIMAAHSALGEKTEFSLAKYTLRKSKKYMKRFTVLPTDVNVLTKIWIEKDPSRIMELREETLGLMMSWGNVHYHAEDHDEGGSDVDLGKGRYLVIDDTCGLVVAAMAEKMGILHASPENEEQEANIATKCGLADEDAEMNDTLSSAKRRLDSNSLSQGNDSTHRMDEDDATRTNPSPGPWPTKRAVQSSAKSNSITVVHANTQPNMSLLETFGYDPDKPDPKHPLFTHLRTLSWLQLLEPSLDPLYQEPPVPEPADAEEANLPLNKRLSALKSGKRSAYWKKRRRWERVKNIVDSTRAGEFDALIVATTMDPIGILKHLVPLVRGGGNVVVYHPSVEPLTQIMDLYSRDRRAGYVKMLQQADDQGRAPAVDEEDFPVDPTLLLNPMLQTARAREWQILPMRTHPVMTSRGGSEGYIFSATRVVPIKGQRVEAKGKFSKKRKTEASMVTC